MVKKIKKKLKYDEKSIFPPLDFMWDRMRETRPRRGLPYLFAKLAALIKFKLIQQVEIIGSHNIHKGAAIFVPNHISPDDPPLIFGILPVCAYIMAKIELFKPVKERGADVLEYNIARKLGWILPYFGTFPIKRGKPDRGNLKTAIDLLKKGRRIIMFPEGHISETKYLEMAKGGAAWLALEVDCPIIPIYILCKEAKWPGKPRYKGRTIVYIGEEI